MRIRGKRIVHVENELSVLNDFLIFVDGGRRAESSIRRLKSVDPFNPGCSRAAENVAEPKAFHIPLSSKIVCFGLLGDQQAFVRQSNDKKKSQMKTICFGCILI